MAVAGEGLVWSWRTSRTGHILSSHASCESEPSVPSGVATTAYGPLVNQMPEMIKVKINTPQKGRGVTEEVEPYRLWDLKKIKMRKYHWGRLPPLSSSSAHGAEQHFSACKSASPWEGTVRFLQRLCAQTAKHSRGHTHSWQRLLQPNSSMPQQDTFSAGSVT